MKPATVDRWAPPLYAVADLLVIMAPSLAIKLTADRGGMGDTTGLDLVLTSLVIGLVHARMAGRRLLDEERMAVRRGDMWIAAVDALVVLAVGATALLVAVLHAFVDDHAALANRGYPVFLLWAGVQLVAVVLAEATGRFVFWWLEPHEQRVRRRHLARLHRASRRPAAPAPAAAPGAEAAAAPPPAMSALGDALEAAAGAAAPGSAEAADLARLRTLAADGAPAAYDRTSRLHVTGSALVLHPPTRRVLLRWHERMGGWLQVGGHGDAGEDDPLTIARREAREETGLDDLAPWPDADRPTIVHAVVVPVPAAGDEPAHEHGDLRYLLATATPERARPEHPGAPLRWVRIEDAPELVHEDNLRTTLARAEALLREHAAGVASTAEW